MISTKEIQAEKQNNGIAHAAEVEGALQGAQDLVRKHFRGISNLHIEEVVDPETGERFSEVVFDVEGHNEDIRLAHKAMTSEWVDSYPHAIRNNIRFAFAII